MIESNHSSEEKQAQNIECVIRFIRNSTLLLALLSITLACNTSTTEDAIAKDQVVEALDALVAKFRDQRPSDVTAYVEHLRAYLENHPPFYGAAAALLDENGEVIASPYVYRSASGFNTLDLAAPDYDIENQAWFSQPLSKDSAIWTPPYFDEGGGEIWMITRAVPVRDGGGIFAIVTTDLPSADPTK